MTENKTVPGNGTKFLKNFIILKTPKSSLHIDHNQNKRNHFEVFNFTL